MHTVVHRRQLRLPHGDFRARLLLDIGNPGSGITMMGSVVSLGCQEADTG